MKKLFVILFLLPLLYACNSSNKKTTSSLLVNESQIAVDSIVNRSLKVYNKASNPLQREKITRDLIADIDSIYNSNQYLFKNIYGVVDDVNIYEHNIKGVLYSNIVAYIADRTNRDFEVIYKISQWVRTDTIENSDIYKSLYNATQYNKVYITGLFDVTDNGMLNIEHSYMRVFNIACKHTDIIKVIDDNLE